MLSLKTKPNNKKTNPKQPNGETMDRKLVNVRRSVNTFYSSYPQRPPANSIFYNKQKIEQIRQLSVASIYT